MRSLKPVPDPTNIGKKDNSITTVERTRPEERSPAPIDEDNVVSVLLCCRKVSHGSSERRRSCAGARLHNTRHERAREGHFEGCLFVSMNNALKDILFSNQASQDSLLRSLCRFETLFSDKDNDRPLRTAHTMVVVVVLVVLA